MLNESSTSGDSKVQASSAVYLSRMASLRVAYYGHIVEAGCDEAGRGCLAGPVFAAAVILPPRFRHPLLNDSKQLSKAQREEVRAVIEARALAWAVGMMDVQEIDRLNILNASFGAMHRAIAELAVIPEHLLIDGNHFTPYPGIPHTCIVKGDATFASIAAASILAKTHRDTYMHMLDKEFPQYFWAENKGYATATHREALQQAGISPHHRRSFRLFPDGQLKLF